MMKKLKVYLDTSIINFLYADDAPEFKKITEEFFDGYVKMNYYEVFVSDVVIDEINRTKDEGKKKKLLQVIKKYNISLVLFDLNAERLSKIYLEDKLVPAKKIDDARHIAIATINNFDILLSWNFKHLSNVNKKMRVKIINEKEGFYYPLDLLTPIQLIYEND